MLRTMRWSARSPRRRDSFSLSHSVALALQHEVFASVGASSPASAGWPRVALLRTGVIVACRGATHSRLVMKKDTDGAPPGVLHRACRADEFRSARDGRRAPLCDPGIPGRREFLEAGAIEKHLCLRLGVVEHGFVDVHDDCGRQRGQVAGLRRFGGPCRDRRDLPREPPRRAIGRFARRAELRGCANPQRRALAAFGKRRRRSATRFLRPLAPAETLVAAVASRSRRQGVREAARRAGTGRSAFSPPRVCPRSPFASSRAQTAARSSARYCRCRSCGRQPASHPRARPSCPCRRLRPPDRAP